VPLPESAHQICSDDAWECRGWTAPGAMTTLVIVTRADFELCGESSWSEVTPGLLKLTNCSGRRCSMDRLTDQLSGAPR